MTPFVFCVLEGRNQGSLVMVETNRRVAREEEEGKKAVIEGEKRKRTSAQKGESFREEMIKEQKDK